MKVFINSELYSVEKEKMTHAEILHLAGYPTFTNKDYVILNEIDLTKYRAGDTVILRNNTNLIIYENKE